MRNKKDWLDQMLEAEEIFLRLSPRSAEFG
jgi:hypothetical protein